MDNRDSARIKTSLPFVEFSNQKHLTSKEQYVEPKNASHGRKKNRKSKSRKQKDFVF